MIILEENFMSKQLRVYREGAKTEFDYQILWEEDFTKLADAVKKLELSCGKICIVADDTVGNLYGKEVQKALEELDVTVDLYTFPAGEASKNLDTVKEAVVSQDLSDPEEIEAVVDDAAKEMNIQLSDEDKQKIVSLMEKISSLDLDVDSLKEQAKDLYNKLESLDLNINQEQVKGFFDRIVSWCKNIWNSIFG